MDGSVSFPVYWASVRKRRGGHISHIVLLPGVTAEYFFDSDAPERRPHTGQSPSGAADVSAI
jgi:hypothetical protein